tara:strand:- start:564 stop:1007 length:444 start_codon:yes stop_codon:yes gene_type:complete
MEKTAAAEKIGEILEKIELTNGNLVSDFIESQDVLDAFYEVDVIESNEVFDFIEQEIWFDDGFQDNIIYYDVAMKYLSQNDPSLRRSLKIVFDSYSYYHLEKNMSSEFLATELATDECITSFQESDEFKKIAKQITEVLTKFNESNN